MRSGWNATCEHFGDCPWLCIGRNAAERCGLGGVGADLRQVVDQREGGTTQATLRRSNTDVTTALTVTWSAVIRQS